MTETQSERSPLARLVLFMICLSIFGSVVAGVHYYAVDLPIQNAMQAPANSVTEKCKEDCADQCSKTFIMAPYCYYYCVQNC